LVAAVSVGIICRNHAYSEEEKHMTATGDVTQGSDRRPVFSALWIFVVLNYLYGDLAMVIFHPATYQRLAGGMNQWLVLGAAAIMQVPIAMVLFSRMLRHGVNRWANIVIGSIFSVFAFVTLLPGRPPAFYVFLSAVEIAATLFIVWYAWTWRESTNQVAT
jgi:hypothetical protein